MHSNKNSDCIEKEQKLEYGFMALYLICPLSGKIRKEQKMDHGTISDWSFDRKHQEGKKMDHGASHWSFALKHQH